MIINTNFSLKFQDSNFYDKNNRIFNSDNTGLTVVSDDEKESGVMRINRFEQHTFAINKDSTDFVTAPKDIFDTVTSVAIDSSFIYISLNDVSSSTSANAPKRFNLYINTVLLLNTSEILFNDIGDMASKTIEVELLNVPTGDEVFNLTIIIGSDI